MKLQTITHTRSAKYVFLMLVDYVLIALALFCSHALVQSPSYLTGSTENLLLYFGLLPVLSVLVIYRLGVYRSVLLHMNTQSLTLIVKSTAVVALAFTALVYLDNSQMFTLKSVPVFWLLVLVLLGGSRLCMNLVLQNIVQNFRPKEAVIIYGAGSSGAQLAAALLAGNQYLPVAFVDDNKSVIGNVINGIRTYNPVAIEKLIGTYAVRQILLALPSATLAERKRILNYLERYPVHVKTVPDLFSMVNRKMGIDEVRDIDIEDLLQREVVPPQTHLLSACIQGEAVLVSGAGGSIGAELCRQIIRLKPAHLILLDNSEYGLYKIESELEEMLESGLTDTQVQVTAILGNVRNRLHVETVLTQFKVKTVYHAAAYKQLPMVEKNIVEGVQNNVYGSFDMARAAIACKVENFVFVSTDKAVRPSSIMGATKRFSEQILQALSTQNNDTCFSMVRFGNVLGSSGSVVPLFREQIEKGGPVTVTHPEVTRYFMTVQEAAQLVIQAGAMATGGDVFVLDMHEPVKILDLARKMIHLMGYMVKDENSINGDIPIAYTGLRPGEKLYEELLIGGAVTGTKHPGIMRAEEDFKSWEELQVMLEELNQACEEMDQEKIRDILSRAIGGFVSRVNDADPVLAIKEEDQKAELLVSNNVTHIYRENS